MNPLLSVRPAFYASLAFVALLALLTECGCVSLTQCTSHPYDPKCVLVPEQCRGPDAGPQ